MDQPLRLAMADVITRPAIARSHVPGDAMKHFARKRFGQHFLTDKHVIGAIVDAIDPKPGQELVEIGPGLGAMTNPLVERCGRMTVIELDRDLAARLRKRPELRVVESDVLKVDFAELAESLAQDHAQAAAPGPGQDSDGARLRVVGNLPYNISTPILFHLLEAVDDVVDQHFMLQKEVVERMVAGPGTKDYGRLSVMLQWRYHLENVLDVPPESFDPPPRVDSAVVRMLPLPRSRVASIDAALLGEAVAVAFSQRRKMLRNTLGHWLEQRQFSGTFDVQRRAEEVPVADYLALIDTLARDAAAKVA